MGITSATRKALEITSGIQSDPRRGRAHEITYVILISRLNQILLILVEFLGLFQISVASSYT